MIPRNDHFLIGLGVSLVVTFIGYFLLLQIDGLIAQGQTIFRPRTLALAAICINVLPMNVFRRTYRTRSMKGLLIGVMGLAAVWFFYYGRALLD